MEAIVLAGGFGTRLRSVVSDVPKPMAPVAGRPFLEILLGILEGRGFRRVVLSLGYMAETVIQHFGTKFGKVELCYQVETTPLGTGGAVRAALSQCFDNHVFVFNGDTFLDLDVGSVEALWEARRNLVIVAREVEDTTRYGRLCVKGDRVIGFLEKGVAAHGLINAGCYVFPKHALDNFELGVPFSLEASFLAEYVQANHVDLFVSDGHFIDIGLPDDYQRAQTELVKFVRGG